MMRKLSTERRKHPRFQLRLPIVFKGEEITGRGVLTNLGRRGCKVESDANPGLGDYITLSLLLPDDAPVKVVSAAVRWSAERAFGVEFLYKNPEDRVLLTEFIENLRQE